MKYKNGFTMVEAVVSTAIIAILLLSISSSNLLSIRTSEDTIQMDEEFNIARSICEEFKCENVNVGNSQTVLYIDNLSEIPQDIVGIINNSEKINTIDYMSIKQRNTCNKKYALLIKGFQNNMLYGIDVTIFSMNNENKGIKLQVVK